MIKGLAIRLLSVSMFAGFVVAACSGSSGTDAPSDAGGLHDARGPDAFGAIDGAAAMPPSAATAAATTKAPAGTGAGACVQHDALRGQWSPGLQRFRSVGRDDGLRANGLRRGWLRRRLRSRLHAVLGHWGPDLQCQRCLGQRDPLRESELCRGRLLRRLHARRNAVLGQRRPDVRGQRTVAFRRGLRDNACTAGQCRARARAARRSARATGCRDATRMGCGGRQSRVRRRRAYRAPAPALAAPDRLNARATESRPAVPRAHGAPPRRSVRVRIRDLHGRVQPRRNALLRRRGTDLRPHRDMGRAALLERGVLGGRMHGRLHFGTTQCSAVTAYGTWDPTGNWGKRKRMPLCVRDGGLHRRVRSGRDAVLGLRSPDLRRQRDVGHAGHLQPELRDGRLHGIVLAGRRAMLGQRRPAVPDIGNLERRELVRESSLCDRRLRGLLHARVHAVHGQLAPDVRLERQLGNGGRLQRAGVLVRFVQWRLPRHDPPVRATACRRAANGTWGRPPPAATRRA